MQLRDYLFQKIESDETFSPVYVNNDYSSPFLDNVKIEHPTRVLNVGIAEQVMVSVASGIQKSGHDALCYSISTFLYSRANEQIKINFISQKIPFYFISMGPGFDYPEDGPSHHCIEENSITFNYPNTRIFNPLTEICLDRHYPNKDLRKNSNIIFSLLRKRLKKDSEEILFSEFKTFEGGYFRDGKNSETTILCHGFTGVLCLDNFRKIIEKEISIIILTDLKSDITHLLKEKQKIIVWSESLIFSGFHSYHNQKINLAFRTSYLIHLGVNPNEVTPYYGDRNMQAIKYGYDVDSLINLI